MSKEVLCRQHHIENSKTNRLTIDPDVGSSIQSTLFIKAIVTTKFSLKSLFDVHEKALSTECIFFTAANSV